MYFLSFLPSKYPHGTLMYLELIEQKLGYSQKKALLNV
jgi:hypothetical protein